MHILTYAGLLSVNVTLLELYYTFFFGLNKVVSFHNEASTYLYQKR